MARVQRVQHVSVGFPAGREAEARKFYGEALGLVEKSRPMGLKDLPVIWFDAGDAEHEIHLLAMPAYQPPERNHLCLEVDDLAEMRAHLLAQQVPIREAEPIDQRPRLMVQDPFGNGIELTQITGKFTPVAE